MKQRIQGLSSSSTVEIPPGVYLVKVQRAHYRWHKHKPAYEVSFFVLKPDPLCGAAITVRLLCSPKELWKFAWFLRDFRYSQLLDRDEIDVRAFVGLEGVLQITSEVLKGRAVTIVHAFAPAVDWEHLALPAVGSFEVA